MDGYENVFVRLRRSVKLRHLFLLVCDVIWIFSAGFLALLTRFDFSIAGIEESFLDNLWRYFPFQAAVTVFVFFLFHLYNSLWEYASVDELLNVIFACGVSVLLHLLGISAYIAIGKGMIGMPRSFWPLEFLLLCMLTGGTRFFYRFLRRMSHAGGEKPKKRILVVGAGDAANTIIREIKKAEYRDGEIVAVVDDDRNKIGAYIQGERIIGSRVDIPWIVEKKSVSDIFIAIPSLPRKEIKKIVDLCDDTPCNIKILPSMQQLFNNEVSVSRLRKVQIEDLLGRDVAELKTDRVMDYVKGKVVMVTGGGGSIGAELCRQIAKNAPKQLIIIEIYENNAYDIEQELRRAFPALCLAVLIASVRNTNRMEEIFSTYHPEVVYHAAAHKHVPLMEVSPGEAVKNNVYGTLKLSRMCDRHGVKRMVLISTDKAVNPTNVMGATKRMCEMIVQAYDNRSVTEFVAVRFGNVLGSNGSVVPLFKKQIAAGGPVTVTHPDIIRYFMTIPEAVSLVLEAGAMAKGGEIYVLDMGEPVRIDDMARNLIRLSGYVPDKDIDIIYTGLRPGEKLYEELLMDEEGLQETEHALIHIGKPISFDEETFLQRLDDMYPKITEETADIRAFIKELVPTYQAADGGRGIT